MALDRDQSADAEKPRGRFGIRRCLPVRCDPVVDDLEVLLLEALGLGEVLRETLRDRDVHMRERADGAVGEAEPAPLAELVEAVLRGEPQRHPRQRAGELPVDVGVHEVRVEDARARAREVGGDLAERDRIDVGAEADVVERDAARAQRVGELPRAGLVLVEHEEPHVPAARAQIGQELQEVRLRAGDARDLLGVEDDAVGHAIPAASRMPRAHDCTEWLAATRARSVCPRAALSSGLMAASARMRSASEPGSQRVKRCSGARSSSKIGLEASTGRHAAAAS